MAIQQVDQRRCIGCRTCVVTCPTDVFRLDTATKRALDGLAQRELVGCVDRPVTVDVGGLRPHQPRHLVADRSVAVVLVARRGTRELRILAVERRALGGRADLFAGTVPERQLAGADDRVGPCCRQCALDGRHLHGPAFVDEDDGARDSHQQQGQAQEDPQDDLHCSRHSSFHVASLLTATVPQWSGPAPT